MRHTERQDQGLEAGCPCVRVGPYGASLYHVGGIKEVFVLSLTVDNTTTTHTLYHLIPHALYHQPYYTLIKTDYTIYPTKAGFPLTASR